MLKRIGFALLSLLLTVELIAAPFGWVVSTYDLTATSYTYCRTNPFGSTPVCGTTTSDGWITVPPGKPIVFAVEWITKAATSLDYSFECRPYTSGLGAYFEDNGQGSLTSATGTYFVLESTQNAFEQCRIGLKLTTDSGTNSVTAYLATR